MQNENVFFMRWRTTRVTLAIYGRVTRRQRQPLRQRQQPSGRHAHENETLRIDNARPVQTPSFAEAPRLPEEAAKRDGHAIPSRSRERDTQFRATRPRQ